MEMTRGRNATFVHLIIPSSLPYFNSSQNNELTYNSTRQWFISRSKMCMWVSYTWENVCKTNDTDLFSTFVRLFEMFPFMFKLVNFVHLCLLVYCMELYIWIYATNDWDQHILYIMLCRSMNNENYIKKIKFLWVQVRKTRGLSAYTVRSSFKLLSIATDACM